MEIDIMMLRGSEAIATRSYTGDPEYDLHVDSIGGLDSNPGTIGLPKKTLASLSGLVSPGTKVGLKRGSVFRETWNVDAGGNSSDIVLYGAYGEGDKPRITGCDILSGWLAEQVSGALFEDGFETGNTSMWSSVTNPGGQVTVTAPSALVGTRGMAVSVATQVHAFVQDDTPDSEKTYRCRFYFDPNTITMGAGAEFVIAQALEPGGASVWFVKLQYVASTYKLFIFERNDSWSSLNTVVDISDGPHYVELYWKAATAAGANDGIFQSWVDGVQTPLNLSNIDSDTLSIASFRMGAVLELDAGTTGALFFDAFYSNATGSAIGATNPVVETTLYSVGFNNPIDTFLLLEDGEPLAKVESIGSVTSPGKYFPDDVNNRIYAWTTNSADPDTHVMEIGVRYDTVNCDDRSYIQFRDLRFHGAGGQWGRNFGLKRTVANPRDITLYRCEVDHGAYNGVQVNHVDGHTPVANFAMYDCDVHHNYDTGVWIIGESPTARITGLRVDGCVIHHNGREDVASMGLFIQSCDTPVVVGCNLHDNNGNLAWSDNLLLGTSNNCIVAYNTVYGGNHSGIHFDVNCNGFIFFNTIYSCFWNGIWFEEHQVAVCGQSIVCFNTIWDCLHGIVLGPGSTIREVSGLVVKNNIMSGCRRANIELNEDGVSPDYLNNTFDYNCYLADTNSPNYSAQFLARPARESQTFAMWKAYTSWDANSKNEDPLLSNPSVLDFSLNGSSPCINAGVYIPELEYPVIITPSIGRYQT